jgi:hypothetical protein
MEFVKTSVEVGGIKIMEPVTAATDLLVSIVCLYAFFKLRSTKSNSPTVRLFTYYFFTMALATLYGGLIGHAFLHLLTFSWKVPGWLISMISVALIERAAISHAQPLLKPSIGKFFATLNIVELLTLTIVVLLTLNFFFVEAHAAYGLLVVVFSFELYVFRKTKAEGSRLLLIAVLISAIAATVHLTELTINPWFNHLDFSHVLMAIAAYVFYLGASKVNEA